MRESSVKRGFYIHFYISTYFFQGVESGSSLEFGEGRQGGPGVVPCGLARLDESLGLGGGRFLQSLFTGGRIGDDVETVFQLLLYLFIRVEGDNFEKLYFSGSGGYVNLVFGAEGKASILIRGGGRILGQTQR